MWIEQQTFGVAGTGCLKLSKYICFGFGVFFFVYCFNNPNLIGILSLI